MENSSSPPAPGARGSVSALSAHGHEQCERLCPRGGGVPQPVPAEAQGLPHACSLATCRSAHSPSAASCYCSSVPRKCQTCSHIAVTAVCKPHFSELLFAHSGLNGSATSSETASVISPANKASFNILSKYFSLSEITLFTDLIMYMSLSPN